MIKVIIRLLRRKASILMMAFMLGISNVILEEDRMINDTRQHLEQKQVVPDDDMLDTIHYEDAR